MNFEEWDVQFDSKSLKKDVEDINSNNQERKEVPVGTYEVKITKLELTQSKKGDPMLACWFKVVAGEYKGQMIFMNQVLTKGFFIHKCNELLRSITQMPVGFESFKKYSLLLADIMEEIDGKLEFQLAYGKDAKGYDTYKIEKKFLVEDDSEENVPF